MNIRFSHLAYGLTAIIALSIGLGFYCLFAFPDPAFSLQKGDRVALLPGESLTQTFTSNRDGLRRIEILFGKFRLEDDAELTLELRDGSCSGAVLAQKRLSGRSFDSEYTYHFLFDRIPNSAGKTYCFHAHFLTNQPIKKDKAPRFFIDEESQAPAHTITNPGGVASQGGGAVAIRPGHTQESFLANVKEFFDRISQYKPFFLKSWYLIAFSSLGLILTFAVTTLLIQEERQKKTP